MTSKLFLRAAALIALFLAVGHSSGSPWAPSDDAQGQAVAHAMGLYRFDVLGFSRSYEDFYRGFGWMLAAYGFGNAILFWLLSGMPPAAARSSRLIIAVLFIETLALTVLAWRYLFWIPLVMSAAIALFLGLALLPRRSSS